MLPNGLIYFYPSSHHLFPHESKVDFSELFTCVFRQRGRFEAKARPDIRRRKRGRGIRIRIRKTGNRAGRRITAEQDNFLALLLVHLGDLLLGVEPKPREVAVFVLGELRCPTLVESGSNDAEFEVGYEIGANIRIVFEEQMPFVVFFLRADGSRRVP